MIRRPWFIMLSCAVLLIVISVLCLIHLRLHDAASRLPERGRVVESIPGCPARVEVLFDARGIPHLNADTEAAAWFAQGYLHARDRFFQMDLARRQAGGRLSEVFGEANLAEDRKMRTLRLAASARRQAALLSAEERQVFSTYAAGVNAALDRFGRWVAPEIWLLGVDPEPWKTEDSLAIGQLMQLDMSWAMGEELQRAVELGRLGRDRAVELWGWTPDEARAWIPPGDNLISPFREHEPITPPMGGVGSNSWAIAPERSASGRPLVANDPHLGVQMPGVFYAIHLRAPSLHVAGASIAGVPGVLVGHTDHVAWGLTLSMLDDQDLFRLTLDDAGDRELIDGRWQPLRTVTERIRVRWQESPVLLKIRLSVHGPLVREQRGEVLALAWTGMHGQSSLRAILGMDRAATVEEVADAWNGVTGPSMNVVAADDRGHILHQVVGRVPNRGRGAGKLPSIGADSNWSWKGFRPMASNPRRLDPEEGFLATANHDLFTEGDFPPNRSFPGEFAPPWRARRIRRVLAARDDWRLSSCLELQGDVVSGRAIAMLKQLWTELEEHGGPTAEILTGWDGRMDVDSVAAQRFASLVRALEAAIGGDEAARDGLRKSPLGAEEILRLLAGGLDEAWWDDVTSSARENRADVVAGVLDRLDRHSSERRWGEVHQVRFGHPMARLPVVGRLVSASWSRGPFPVAGDNVTVNAHYFSRRRPFTVSSIPSMRFVAEVGNWDETILVLPVGESGRPWSAHYADQIGTWLEVGSARFPFGLEAVERAAVASLELRPAGGAEATEEALR